MKKLRYFYIVLVGIACTLHAQAQQWSKTFGGGNLDRGWSVEQTFDGDFIVLGTTESFGTGGVCFYLIKTDPLGDTIWTNTFPGAVHNISTVQQTSDSGYVIVGTTDSFGAGENDIYVIKTDAFGDTIWTKTFGGSEMELGTDVRQTSDGGYIISGWTQSFGVNGTSVYLIKTDDSGGTIWTKTYRNGWNLIYRVKETSGGGFIVAGGTSLTQGGGESDIRLIRTDANGNVIWIKTFGGYENDEAWDIQQTSDGGYFITGATRSFGMGGWDYYLIKTDSVGNTRWTKTYGGSAGDATRSGQQTSDGGYIISGWACSFGGSYQAWILKTNSTGDIIWDHVLGGFAADESTSIKQTSDGGYISVGYTRSYGAGDADIWLIKLEPDVPTNVDRNMVICEKNMINFYPNPAKNNISLVSQPGIEVKSIEILDINGILIRKIEVPANNKSLNISDLPNGIYILNIHTDNGAVMKKLIKQ